MLLTSGMRVKLPNVAQFFLAINLLDDARIDQENKTRRVAGCVEVTMPF